NEERGKREKDGRASPEPVQGKHRGRNALRQRVQALGYHHNHAQLNRDFQGFKVLADRKKEIYDADIEALAEAEIHGGPTSLWSLESFHTSAGTGSIPAAAVCPRPAHGPRGSGAASRGGPPACRLQTLQHIT